MVVHIIVIRRVTVSYWHGSQRNLATDDRTIVPSQPSVQAKTAEGLLLWDSIGTPSSSSSRGYALVGLLTHTKTVCCAKIERFEGDQLF